VSETGSGDSWFNLACAGSAMAKMHLLRHTQPGSLVPVTGAPPVPLADPSTLPERQAMLKMLTADYCGDGRSFTRTGQPLRYMDRRHWYPGVPFSLDPAAFEIGSIEAIWGASGAVCLSQPRLAAMDEIQDHCRQVRRFGGKGRPSLAGVVPILVAPTPVPSRLFQAEIPVCTPADVANWFNLGHVISANPMPSQVSAGKALPVYFPVMSPLSPPP
jgi:hypothetical protein